ncbi:MAG: YihA family ribosome biogenesis GTP-binding protein [Bacteroidetes bacterium]|nr:YihA family ribosome biogenesis GTP-binding protein [Bacteroidota bacterium]
MLIHSADFTCSYVDWKKCPNSTEPEYAFIGRSNVGKSSLINTLTERKGLAKTSNTPGKTQCINFFLINKEWNLVDLPGYGYAKTSKSNREVWLKFTKEYLSKRPQLRNTFILIDARIPPQKIDLDFINWMGEKGIPFSIVFTKNDKPKKTLANIEKFKETLLEFWEELPTIFITSSVTNAGREDVLSYIEEVNGIEILDIDEEV